MKVKFWLRPLERGDLDFLRVVRESAAVFLGTFVLMGRESQEEWFDVLRSDCTRQYFVFGSGCTRMGYVRIMGIDWVNRSMSVGGDIAKEYRGKGYGLEMYRLVLDLGFNKWNMNRLWLKVMATNGVALRLYRRCGFVVEGVERQAVLRDGKAENYVLMSMLREEYVR